MSKQTDLDAIAENITNNKVCPELAEQATQLVMGSGDVDADIVFIGEAPGKQEDLHGEPFIGASGTFLNEMLASVSLSREGVYITNIVKYRPPKNRDPTLEEKKAFLPYLLQQLSIVKPKLIITLGRHSMEFFLPGMKISEVHGIPVEKNLRIGGTEKERDFLFLPLYHPAAALYNGSLRQTLLDDFKQVPTLLQKIT